MCRAPTPPPPPNMVLVLSRLCVVRRPQTRSIGALLDRATVTPSPQHGKKRSLVFDGHMMLYGQNIVTLVTLISDIAMATSRARQRNGVVQRCAKGPRGVQNAARAAEVSVTIY